jgi:copper homeostasis protein
VIRVEGCVESIAGAVAAERAGAARIELCANLAEQGTTPELRTLEEARTRLAIPIVVMIRPRAGGFAYTSDELATMERDIARARAAGAAGVALGTLTPDGAVDLPVLRALLRAAGPLETVFHRAFDAIPDKEEALEALIDAGVTRVLTSGGAPTALEGLPAIAALVARARGRVAVMPGGEVDAPAATALVRQAGVRELHVGPDEPRLRAVVAAVSGADGWP